MPIRRLLLPLALLLTGNLLGAAAAAEGPLEGLVLPFRQVEVPAPVTSRLLELKVAEGAVVQEGQPLALLYGKLEELELQRAKILLERREFEAKGARRLFENKIIPEAKAMESKVELELARLAFETAAEQVRVRTVLSPISGVVVARHREVGEAVAAAQPLFRILDLSRVLVQCEVEPGALAPLAPGRKVRVRVILAEGPLEAEGEVGFVEPSVNAEGRVRVKLRVDNPGGRIRSGSRAQVDLSSPR